MIVLLQFIPIVWLSIAIGGVIGLILSFYGIRFAREKHLGAPLLHVSGALLILSVSVQLAVTYFAGSNTVLYVVLIINCTFWALLGVWQKLIYFTLAGVLGIAVISGYAFYYVIP